jgi:hypothetical protein
MGVDFTGWPVDVKNIFPSPPQLVFFGQFLILNQPVVSFRFSSAYLKGLIHGCQFVANLRLVVCN